MFVSMNNYCKLYRYSPVPPTAFILFGNLLTYSCGKVMWHNYNFKYDKFRCLYL